MTTLYREGYNIAHLAAGDIDTYINQYPNISETFNSDNISELHLNTWLCDYHARVSNYFAEQAIYYGKCASYFADEAKRTGLVKKYESNDYSTIAAQSSADRDAKSAASLAVSVNDSITRHNISTDLQSICCSYITVANNKVSIATNLNSGLEFDIFV